jgi:hypothetical protein
MSFLSPAAIAIAAALTVPPLIALYFLKLKRQIRVVPSTLLWKRSVEDLRVNAPFQRLRSSLLLLLQLLVLLLAAFALGQPMLEQAARSEETVILLIDQSASMGVEEQTGKTRLDLAKEQAKSVIDNLTPDSRAMVVAFCDRATVVSSFDSDPTALKQRIDSIEQTQSTTTLSEAVSLAEAYAQQVTLAGREPSLAEAPAASVYLCTDGRVSDARAIALQHFEAGTIRVQRVGTRSDNVGIIAMDARRNYEDPLRLEVSATIRNFGRQPAAPDAVLYMNGDNIAIKSPPRPLAPGSAAPAPAAEEAAPDGGSVDAPASPESPASPQGGSAASPASTWVCSFEVESSAGGVVEIELKSDDALKADNHAWTIVDDPRHISVLLVTTFNPFLERILSVMPLDLTIHAPRHYETAPDDELTDGDRSRFDVVILDGHRTTRLPHGNYMFWGATPAIEGLAEEGIVDDEIIFNWDETHTLLRYVAIEPLYIYQWKRLRLPPEATSIVHGQTTPVISHLTRGASQYLICAFRLIGEDEFGSQFLNTNLATQVDFVVFMTNAIQFLSSNVATTGRKSLRPGEPATFPVPAGTRSVSIRRPDTIVDEVSVAGYQTVHYARTRQLGAYLLEPGVRNQDRFAVNLFDPVESNVAPADTIELGAQAVTPRSAAVEVDRPAWRYLVLAVLGALLVEWIVYNLRVFV